MIIDIALCMRVTNIKRVNLNLASCRKERSDYIPISWERGNYIPINFSRTTKKKILAVSLKLCFLGTHLLNLGLNICNNKSELTSGKLGWLFLFYSE